MPTIASVKPRPSFEDRRNRAILRINQICGYRPNDNDIEGYEAALDAALIALSSEIFKIINDAKYPDQLAAVFSANAFGEGCPIPDHSMPGIYFR